MVNFATLVLGADTRGLRPAKDELKALTAEAAKTEKQTDQTSASVSGMGDRAGQAAPKVTRLRDATGRFIPAGQQAAAAAAAAAAGITKQGAAANLSAVAMAKASTAAGMLSNRLLAMGVAAFGIGAVTRELAGFETSMSQVSAVTRATAEELEDLRDVAKELGGSTEFSAKQAADGLAFLGQAGFSAANAIAAIPDVLDLATAAQLGLADAADIASNIMSGFGIAANDAGNVADVLAAAAARSNTNVSQLGQAMSTVAPISKSLGISLEDTAAAIGVMSDAGIQGERAGTALRGALASLAGPTDGAVDVLNRLGLTAESVNPQMNDMDVIFGRLKASGMTMADAIAIFGREAASGALVLTEMNGRLGDLGDELGTVDGEAKRMADTMRDNLGGDLADASSAVSSLVIELGERGLTAALRSSVQAGAELTRWITTNLTPAFQTATIVISALAFTQLPAATAAMYAFATAGGTATFGVGLFTAAVNVARAATIALGGPLGIVWGLIGAAAGAWIVFGDNASEAEVAIDAAKKSSDALNAALGTFYSTAAPSAGAAAINLANDNYKLAASAVAAAEAELAKKQALVDFATGSGQGQATMFNMEGTFAPEVAAAEEQLRRTREMLVAANSARDRAARAVASSATAARMPAHPENLALNIDLNLPDMPDVPIPETDTGGGSKGAGAGKKSEAQKQAEAAAEAIAKLRQEHTDLQETVGMTAEQERIYAAVQELGTGATAEQVSEVQRLIPEIDALREAKERMAQAADRGKAALENLFGSIIDGSKSAKTAVLELLAQVARTQLLNQIFRIPGMGAIGSSIGNALTPTFSGGGSTGDGPRSGGVDGEGGFYAVLHPKETVIDHTASGGGVMMQQEAASGRLEVALMLSDDVDARIVKGASQVADIKIERFSQRQMPNQIAGMAGYSKERVE